MVSVLGELVKENYPVRVVYKRPRSAIGRQPDGENGLVNTIATFITENRQQVVEERRLFFEGLIHLMNGEMDQAAVLFRKSVRDSPSSLDSAALWAVAQCYKEQGKQGLALRAWTKVAENKELSTEQRRFAWMSIAALQEARGARAEVEKAQRAVEQMMTQSSTCQPTP